MIRRGFIALTLIFLVEYPQLQLILIMSSSIIYVIYMIRYQPFCEKEQNKDEIINELFIISIA